MSDLPPKPASRPERVSLWRYARLFRKDILSAQPEKLYRAWMAEFKTPFFRSYLCNQPQLVDLVLRQRPQDFPKSDRVGEGLRPLLGNSVFLTNGADWQRQRRIIDPAFEGGRLRDTFPAMHLAAQALVSRLDARTAAPIEIEAEASHAAADVIFRTLFSMPIEHEIASEVFSRFRDYQRVQPILNLAAFLKLPKWFPRLHRREGLTHARRIRALISQLTQARLDQLAEGVAPDDLATKIMTTPDPVTGQRFELEEMVDQVAIFFLAGHETSAAALSWALYLLATHPQAQARVAAEAAQFANAPSFAKLSQLRFTRDVFREALRLYPPVPMMVREAAQDEVFRDRQVRKGAQIVLSPWHLHRHTQIWDNPDGFDPDRWSRPETKTCQREAFMPFSAGPRVCTGAGFAMAEGVILIATILARFQVLPEGPPPVPVAHLTVRAKDGIWLRLSPR